MKELYSGWKNRSTWNVSLWINNDEQLYRMAVEFMKNYKGKKPYYNFVKANWMENDTTQDNIKWLSTKLDYKALNEMMFELVG